MKVKSESEVAQSCPTLSDPMDCSPPDSSVHGIFQATVLEWGAIAFSSWKYYLLINLGKQNWYPLWQDEAKIMASGPITSWEIDGESVETVSDFICVGSRITADGDCSHEIKNTYSLEEKLWPT